jgi:large subunit ribosomal protein L30
VAKKLKVTLVKSIIGLSPKQEGTVHALGLRRIRQVVEHDDTPTIRGMISHVVFAVEVDEMPGAAVAGQGEPKASRADIGIEPSGSKKKAERSEAKS